MICQNLATPQSLNVNGRQFALVTDPHNARAKIYGITASDFSGSSRCLELLRTPPERSGFSKVTVYTRPGQEGVWQALGFRREAVIHGFFQDRCDAHLWACYTDPTRAVDPRAREHAQTLRQVSTGSTTPVAASLPPGHACDPAAPELAGELSGLLRATFCEYPSPLEPAYIRQCIETGSHHFRVIRDARGEIVAAASAEIDLEQRSAELTDCATRPDQRGRGLMGVLLSALEEDLRNAYGIQDVYTIARADEPGINRAFAKRAYQFTGCLVNNCRMPLGWESMNVWCRQLDKT
ncbi:GNAT family N-acetyltransferase [Thermithiobacillus plumbiphilus]|uniref:GNAT family N-acetyltransferase n=1 Tax=Thermithiobacillus plumbiphilus TaxID=1729899 RepID=A0ABU9D4B2_9PROT